MERSRDWLFQAQGDLEHARVALGHGSYDWSCFTAQQAAEKAAKAVLKRLGADAWGQSVTGPLTGPGLSLAVPPDLLDGARELDKAYITSRYPDALPAGAPRSLYTRAEAERLVGYADAIVRFCSDQLSGS